MKTPNTLITKTDQPWTDRWAKKFSDFDLKDWPKKIEVPASVIDLAPVAEDTAARAWYETKGKEIIAACDFGMQPPPSFLTVKECSYLPPLNVLRRDIEPVVKREKQPRHRTAYLDRVYDPKEFQRTVQETLELMREHADDFDAIAFRGSSGAALAFIAGYELNKPLIHIRKTGEGNHYCAKLEGFLGAKRIAIVDDFVASGDTIREIVDVVLDTYGKADYVVPVFPHLFLYSCGLSTQEGTIRGALGECSEEMAIHLAYDRNRF